MLSQPEAWGPGSSWLCLASASVLVPQEHAMALSLQDINAYNGEQPAEKLPFPIIADKNRELAVKLGMLDPDEQDKDGMPLTARVVSPACPTAQSHGCQPALGLWGSSPGWAWPPPGAGMAPLGSVTATH